MSFAQVRKSLLALLLAILLVASMLPLFTYNASAATYYSATGVVTDATMNTITILKSGRYRTFSKSDAKILKAPNGISLKDTVKIVYNATNPQEAVQIIMVSQSASQNRRPHDTHVLKIVTGVITDATMNTVTISTGREEMSFSQENTQFLNADDGILLGDRVRITYYEDNPSEAIQLYMIAHSRRHSNYGNNAPQGDRQFIGEIVAVGDTYFVCEDSQTGVAITFFYDARHYDGPDLDIGRSVIVMYNQQYPSISTDITVVR